MNKGKQEKLINKVKHLLKKTNTPEFLRKFGPKTYKFYKHALAILLKEVMQCSFRRISNLLNMLEIKVPTYSALCKSRKRIPQKLWENILKLTAGINSGKIAIDSTGFSRTNPSFHYVKRIDAKKPVRRYAKLSALFDIPNRKFTTLKIRARPRHDIMDAKYLLKRNSNTRLFYADSAYDAESLHEHCFWENIQTMIKPKKKVKKGYYRRKQMKNYSDKEYHQRSLVESGFGSLKRKYGGSVKAIKFKGFQTEIYCKAIAHNIGLIS